MTLRKILVTGATGFVGRSVITRLLSDTSNQVFAGVRNEIANTPHGSIPFVLGAMGEQACPALPPGINTVIHCAARVHVMVDDTADPLAEYRRVNVEGTMDLARRAVESGVQRFIFISSIKVNGESTDGRAPFTPDEIPNPSDPYGKSKLEAEKALQVLAAESGIEVVIIRPVLIYGPGVKANFSAMIKCLLRGLPLPLGRISNKRSLAALENVVDLIKVCIEHQKASNQIFLVSDGEDLSTPELLRRTAKALGVKARLLPVSNSLITIAAHILMRPQLATRLCGSLQVDITKTTRMLAWTPPVSVDQGLAMVARHFLESSNR